MTLASVIAESFGGSQRAFARAARIDEGQLSKYLAAERGEPNGSRPGADSIAAIERASGGKITAAYWAGLKRRARSARGPRPS